MANTLLVAVGFAAGWFVCLQRAHIVRLYRKFAKAVDEEMHQ